MCDSGDILWPGGNYLQKSLCQMARRGDPLAVEVQQLPDIPFFDSGASVLRDGSIVSDPLLQPLKRRHLLMVA